MDALKALMLMFLTMGVSVCTPANNRLIAEKVMPSKNGQNKGASSLYSRNVILSHHRHKIPPQELHQNKQLAMQNITKAAKDGEGELKKLQLTRNRIKNSNHIESGRTKRTHGSSNVNSDDENMIHMLKTGNNIRGSLRIRRGVPLEDDSEFGSGRYSNGFNDDEDYEDFHGESVEDEERTPNTLSYAATTTEMAHVAVSRKCCPNGETFLQARSSCARSSSPLIKHFRIISTNGKRLLYKDYSPCGFGGHRLHNHNKEYFVSDHGFLSFQNTTYSPEEFCFEAFLDSEEILPVVCYKHESYHSSSYVHIIVGKAIAIPFLLVTLIIYIFIAELHNSFGIAVLCHSITLLFAYIIFIAVEHVYAHIPSSNCRSYAFVIFIMFESSFFWLNVMCYDLCWSVCMLKRLSKKIKIILYSCYAWGMPLVFVIIFLHQDIVPGIPRHHLRPEYGAGGCLYSVKMDHFYPPVIVLQVCNVLLLAGSFFKLLCNNRGKLEVHRKQLVESKQLYDVHILYCKVLLVIGIVTVTLIIIWILDARIIMWYLVNLQEIFICIALVFNNNILSLLNKRRHNTRAEKHKESYYQQNAEGASYTTPDMADVEMKTLQIEHQSKVQQTQ